ncbi:MAG: peptidoglycan editing factor PgeF [Lachnospiraceae bacterium]|nr:peptidoglycan editing factor PgeF [Lachnospiraceae bacterium]
MVFKLKNNDDIFLYEEPVLKFKKLENTGIVKHCFTTRLGGVSTGIYESMNLGPRLDDDLKNVKENYRRVGNILGVGVETMVLSKQTHTTNVRVITKEDAGNGTVRENTFTDVDGMVTNEKNITLSTHFADCVPLFFVDPVHKAIGLSHSGWRGTVNRMGRCTIEKMISEYGTDPKDLVCAIGPSICKDCYEVGEELYHSFKESFGGRTDELFEKKENSKYMLDLWRANEIVLIDAGVKEENIATTNICTCCNSKLLFSHRASKGKRGLLGAFLALK